MARIFHFGFLGLGLLMGAAIFNVPVFVTPAHAFGLALAAVHDPARLPPETEPLRLAVPAHSPMHISGGPAAERSSSGIVLAAANVGNLSAPAALNMRRHIARA